MDDGRTYGQMAERSMAQKTRHSFKEIRDVDIVLTTQQCIPEDSELHTRHSENLKSHKRDTVLDAFKGHLTEKVKTVASKLLNTDLVITPGGMTSQLQVLDVVLNKPFKDYVE
jgi:hypothetical protein